MNQVSKSATRALLVVVALVLAAVVWTVASRTTHQADLRQQLARDPATAEPLLAGPSDAIAAPVGAVSGAPRALPGEHHEEPSQAEVARRRDEAIRKQESAFIGEPLDPNWASAQMTRVNAALKPDAMAQYGAMPPRSASVDCRSQHCRIVAVYDDMDQAELGQFALGSGIGNTLPVMTSFMLEQSDGTQRLVIYANANPGMGPKSH